jgi:hypothetical protein
MCASDGNLEVIAVKSRFVLSALLLCCALLVHGQTTTVPQPAADEWLAKFDGSALDETKWERFSLEGGTGGTFKVEGGQLHIRSVSGSRSGVRTKQKFKADRFIVEATLAKVGLALAEEGKTGVPLGYANLTVLFDDSGRNRVEWILTSEGVFEAWAIVDGVSSRIDNHKLGTKTPSPTVGIVRRGDDFLFMLNGQVGMQKTVKNLPHDFWVMLYGYGSSENNWSSVRVATMQQAH